MRRMAKAVVIGFGRVGRNHVEAYQSSAGTEVVGIAEVDDEQREQLGDALDVPESRRYADTAAALETDPDVVSVTTPAALHARHVREAIDVGDPEVVWCEKPLATSVREGDRLVEHANDNDVELLVNHSRRFSETFETVYDLLHNEGVIGELQTARVSTGLQLLNLGTHYMDLILYLLDDRVTRVTSGSVTKSPVDDGVQFIGGGVFETEKGYRGEFETTRRGIHRLDLIGDEGRLSVPLGVKPSVTPTFELHHGNGYGRDLVATAGASDDGVESVTGTAEAGNEPLGEGDADAEQSLRELAETWHHEATETPETYKPGYVPAQPMFENAVGHIELLIDGYDNAASGTRAVHGLEVLTGFAVASETGGTVDLPLSSPLRGVSLRFEEPEPAQFSVE